MKSNQKGFSSVEILIAVVVIGLIGVIGWLVYDRQNNNTDSQQANTSQTQSETKKDQTAKQEEAEPTDETATWKEVTNAEFGFSYKYPTENGWETFLIAADPQRYADGQRVNNAGVDYSLCGKNCGLVFSFGVYAKGSSADPGDNWGEVQMSGNSLYSLSSEQSVTKNGVTGTRWEYTPSSSSVVKIVYYYFSNDGLSYAFSVNSNGATTDQVDLTEYGEKIMDTFQFTN